MQRLGMEERRYLKRHRREQAPRRIPDNDAGGQQCGGQDQRFDRARGIDDCIEVLSIRIINGWPATNRFGVMMSPVIRIVVVPG